MLYENQKGPAHGLRPPENDEFRIMYLVDSKRMDIPLFDMSYLFPPAERRNVI